MGNLDKEALVEVIWLSFSKWHSKTKLHSPVLGQVNKLNCSYIQIFK